MSNELKLMGVAAYSGAVFLAIIWGAVGISYWRNGKHSLMWGALTVSMTAFALLFIGLSVIAAEPWWVNRMMMTWYNRLMGLTAVSAGGVFTWQYLEMEWRRTKTMPPNDKRPYL